MGLDRMLCYLLHCITYVVCLVQVVMEGQGAAHLQRRCDDRAPVRHWPRWQADERKVPVHVGQQ